MANKCEIASVFINDLGFCQVKYDIKNGQAVNLEQAKGLCESICRVCNGTPNFILHDGRDTKTNMGQEVREYIRNFEGLKSIRLGSAFVVNSFLTRVLANLYISYTRETDQPPSKVFDNIEDATSWLLQMKKERKATA